MGTSASLLDLCVGCLTYQAAGTLSVCPSGVSWDSYLGPSDDPGQGEEHPYGRYMLRVTHVEEISFDIASDWWSPASGPHPSTLLQRFIATPSIALATPPTPQPLAQIGNVCSGAGYTDQFVCYDGEYPKITCIRALCSGGVYTDDVVQCPNLDRNSLSSIATSGGIAGSLAEFNLNGAGYSCGNQQTLSFDRKGIMGAAIQLFRSSGNNPNPHQLGIRMGPRSSAGHFDYMFNFYHDAPLYCQNVNNLHCDCRANFHDMISSNENAPARAIACKYTVPSEWGGRPSVAYSTLDRGTCCCDSSKVIQSKAECFAAVNALRSSMHLGTDGRAWLDWSGSRNYFGGGCYHSSYTGSVYNTDFRSTSSSRSDLMPVCHV